MRSTVSSVWSGVSIVQSCLPGVQSCVSISAVELCVTEGGRFELRLSEGAALFTEM